MKILIMGAGSIGVYLGVLLYSRDNEVTLLGGKKLSDLHESLLIDRVSYKLPLRTYEFPENASYDFIFITSKLYDLRKNLKGLIKNNLHAKILVSVQNGTVDKSLYLPFIENTKFTTISIFEGYRIIENQLVTSSTGEGWKTEDTLVGQKVVDLLANAGIKIIAEPNLERIKAEKLVMNCAINLLSATKKKTFQELCASRADYKRINLLFDESYEIMNSKIVLTQKDELKKYFFKIVSKMPHYSSTYQDAISGRKTEVDFLNGLIVKFGKQQKLPVSENESILKEFNKIYSK